MARCWISYSESQISADLLCTKIIIKKTNSLTTRRSGNLGLTVVVLVLGYLSCDYVVSVAFFPIPSFSFLIPSTPPGSNFPRLPSLVHYTIKCSRF